MSTSFGYLMAFVAMGFYAVLPVITKKITGATLPPFTFIALTMAGLSALAALGAVLFEKNVTLSAFTRREWVGLAVFVVCNFIGFAVTVWALPKVPVGHWQLIGALTPVVGGMAAYVLLQETLDLRFFIGFALVAAGLSVVLVK